MPSTSIRKALAGKVPLIGFAGSPWTLACYMVEGSGSDDYRLVKTMLYQRPDLLHRILAVNAEAVARYLNAQIDAGAQAVMVFDSWGGVLADGAFQSFSLAYTRAVLSQLKRDAEGRRVPHIVFTKGGGPWLEEIAASGADVVGVDWTVEPGHARDAASAAASRCKATSTRPCCSAATTRSGARWRPSSRASGKPGRRAATTATSSISATASASTRRPTRSASLVEVVHALSARRAAA